MGSYTGKTLFRRKKGFPHLACRLGRCFCLRQRCPPDIRTPFPKTAEFLNDQRACEYKIKSLQEVRRTEFSDNIQAIKNGCFRIQKQPLFLMCFGKFVNAHSNLQTVFPLFAVRRRSVFLVSRFFRLALYLVVYIAAEITQMTEKGRTDRNNDQHQRHHCQCKHPASLLFQTSIQRSDIIGFEEIHQLCKIFLCHFVGRVVIQ